MITREECPFGICAHLRKLLPLGGLTSCIYCMSVWMAALCNAVWLTPLQPLVVIVAISGASLMLAAYSGAHHLS